VDRIGRRSGLIFTTVGAALSSGLTAISPWAWWLVVVRFISGLGYSEQAVNSTYLNEMYAAAEQGGERVKSKGLTYSFIQGGWPVGVLFAAAMTAALLPVTGWREIFAIATFPAIVIAILGRRLKETPQFLRMKEVRALLRPRGWPPTTASRCARRNATAANAPLWSRCSSPASASTPSSSARRSC
jgi:MFS family permease